MSVYGALYSSVSGIQAQGVAIGIISDNISNVNTIGYKAGSQYFGTLVTAQGGGSSYSPGGVRAVNRQTISKQGLLQTTSSPLDVAIQGNGMFVVSSATSGSGDILYTRAGSFRTDQLGNFVNPSGYYLQAWPLDANGNIPANSSSLETLQTVNIGDAFGEASATTSIAASINLDANQPVLKGSGQVFAPGDDGINDENDAISAYDIMVPNANMAINSPRTTGSASAIDRTAALNAATTAGNTAGTTSVNAGNNAATAAAAAVAALAAVSQITAVTGAAAAATAAGTAAITATATTTAATTAGTTASTAATTAGTTAGTTSVGTGANSATAGAAAVAAAAAAVIASAQTAATAAGTAAIASSAAAATAAGSAASTAVSTATSTAGTTLVTGGETDLQVIGDAMVTAGIGVSNVTAIPGAVTAVTAAGNAAIAAGILATDTPAQLVTRVAAAMATAANTAVAAGTTVAAAVAATAAAASTAAAAATTVTAAVTAAAAAGADAVGLASADFNGDILRISTGGTFNDDFVYGGFSESLDISDGILGASTSTQQFNGSGIANGDAFTIVIGTDTLHPSRFEYVAGNPTAANGTFSDLQTLADAIDAVEGLTARVATVGSEVKLFVSAEDATKALTFATATNDVTNAASTANFPTALGLYNVTSEVNRWNTMDGLAKLVNEKTSGRLVAKVTNAGSTTAALEIYNSNPLTDIQFANLGNTWGTSGSNLAGDFLTEFGISGTVQNASYSALAGSDRLSMASGNITPHFERSITIYDSQGASHDVRMGFVKVGVNNWRAEIYAADASDIVSTVVTDSGSTDTNDRFIASGQIQFDGNGNLLTSGLTLANVNWEASGANQSSINIDLGDLRQAAGLYNVANISQNGAAVGLLDSVSIDEGGYVIANFNNGQSASLYKIPLATFSNYDGLEARNGNVFIQTINSGNTNLSSAGSDGAGTISPESLETSNSELSEELTDMIVAQRAYQASAKVITTADQLLDDLNRIT